jgi:hypothetical protein
MRSIKVALRLKNLGAAEEWFLVVDRQGDKRNEQERGRLLGRHKEIAAMIQQLRHL